MDPRLHRELIPRPPLGEPIGVKPNLCPCGCRAVDENGYCRHLVGFTTDGKTMEIRELIRDHESYEMTGRKTEPVLKTDKIVQIPAAGAPRGTYLATARVYRAGAKAPIKPTGEPSIPKAYYGPDDLDDEEEDREEAEAKATAPVVAPATAK